MVGLSEEEGDEGGDLASYVLRPRWDEDGMRVDGDLAEEVDLRAVLEKAGTQV